MNRTEGRQPDHGTAWFMTAPGQPFERRRVPLGPCAAGEMLVQVAGCGVCHTDISFLHLGVKTRAELPLVLGHEISGTVAAVGEGVDPALEGRPVLIPAVLPCGECEVCRKGHRRICPRQIMPGNDRHGGFASHVSVPARYVQPIPPQALAEHELWELAVVADAVTTPFQAVRRSGLTAGDLAVFIGIGGIGIHGVQIAHAAGARVLALDVDPRKLEAAAGAGADAAIDLRDLDQKGVRTRVREEGKRLGAPGVLWKIFETSGTKAGQETAFGLLGQGAVLSIVGFTPERCEVRLSNLMAFDASLHGNWGCDPLLYGEVLSWIAEGRIRVRPFVERHPLEEINQVFEAAHQGRLARRAVLVP
jgi:6-hydroxycyclohex-1-ene-1-carbonyl-CoA dehydrogenase